MSAKRSEIKSRRDPAHSRPAGPHFAPAGAFVLPRGKYRGQRLSSVPASYVEWLARESFDPAVRAAALAFTGTDGHGEGAEPDTLQFAPANPESAAILFPLIVFEFERMTADRFGLNPTGPEREIILWCRDALRQLCSEVTGRAFLPDEEVA